MTTPTLSAAADLMPLLPELVLIGGAFALLMLDLFLDANRRFVTQVLALVLLAVVMAMIACGTGGHGTVFHGMFVRDVMADVSKVVILLTSALSLLYAWPYLRERKLYPGEVPVLILFAYVLAVLFRVSLKMFRERRVQHTYVSQWYLFASTLWFPILYLAAVLLPSTGLVSGAALGNDELVVCP